MNTRAITPMFLGLLTVSADADVVWTGATSNDVFEDSNWDFSTSPVTAVDPNVSVDDDVRITNATSPPQIPDLGGQIRFQIGDGFTLTIDSSTLLAVGNDGVGGAPGTTVGPLVNVVNGGQLETFFITNRVALDLDSISSATFGGGATPINGATVDLTFGAVLAFTDETVADFTTEHLSKVTVDGAPAVIGVNLDVISDGNIGSIVTVIPTPVGTPYCFSFSNSSGNAATIQAFGSPDVAVQSLTLVSSGLPANVPGIFYFGSNQIATPFGDGFRCVGGMVLRLPFNQADASGILTEPNVWVHANAASLQPGTTWNFQSWFRDAPAMMTGFNLSDGVTVALLP